MDFTGGSCPRYGINRMSDSIFTHAKESQRYTLSRISGTKPDKTTESRKMMKVRMVKNIGDLRSNYEFKWGPPIQIYTYIFYRKDGVIRFSMIRVRSPLEFGSVHHAIACYINPDTIFAAGEVRIETDAALPHREINSFTYNLMSGSFMAPYMNSILKRGDKDAKDEDILKGQDIIIKTLTHMTLFLHAYGIRAEMGEGLVTTSYITPNMPFNNSEKANIEGVLGYTVRNTAASSSKSDPSQGAAAGGKGGGLGGHRSRSRLNRRSRKTRRRCPRH
jgi:hypothetical protein